MILTECIGYFKSTEEEFIKPSGKIIASIASSSMIAANTIGEKVVPILFQELEMKKKSGLKEKQSFLIVIVDLIMSTRVLYTSLNEIEKRKNPLYLMGSLNGGGDAGGIKEKLIQEFVTILLKESNGPILTTCLCGITRI